MHPVACWIVEGIPVQNKTVLSVIAIIVLIALGASILTLVLI